MQVDYHNQKNLLFIHFFDMLYIFAPGRIIPSAFVETSIFYFERQVLNLKDNFNSLDVIFNTSQHSSFSLI